MRLRLGLSRAEFARFLGVSEPTVVRWESDNGTTEPRGLQALLIRAIDDALISHAPAEIARIIRSCAVDHGGSLRQLLAYAETPQPATDVSLASERSGEETGEE